MFMIVVRGKAGDAKCFEFDQPVVTIGRAEVNDIVLPMTNVSKRHARITISEDGFVLHDRHSTNGTYVNGRKLLAPLLLGEADQIHIGDFVLLVSERPVEQGAPLPGTGDESGLVVPGEAPGSPLAEGPGPHGGTSEALRMPWLDEWMLSTSPPAPGGPVTTELSKLQLPGAGIAASRARADVSLKTERAGGGPVICDVFASVPAVVPLRQSLTLRLFADATTDFLPDEGHATSGRPSFVVEVNLCFPDGGLEPIAGEQGLLRVALMERSAELSFPLWARELGPARVEIGLSHRGARLCTLVLRVEVRDPAVVPPPSAATPRVLPGRDDFFALSEMSSGARIESVAPSFAPSAVLRLRENGSAGSRRHGLRIELLRVQGELPELLSAAEITIESKLEERMRGLYRSPQVELAGTLLPARREALLRGLGESLATLLLPQPVHEALLGLPAGMLLQVDTTETWVPWEVVRIGRGARAAYLAERFALGRSGLGSYTTHFARAPRLLISPPCSTFVSRREKQALSALDARLRQVHRLSDLKPHLQQAGIAGWHVSGRGGFDRGDRSAAVLHLEDGVLTPAQLAPAQRFQKLGMHPPLQGLFVLLNISERDQPEKPFLPAGSAQWVERFFAAGAGAVIATFFPVTDDTAGLFSEAFYRSWASGRPLGVAVSEAREVIRREGDVSWLSYCVYGLPGALLSD